MVNRCCRAKSLIGYRCLISLINRCCSSETLILNRCLKTLVLYRCSHAVCYILNCVHELSYGEIATCLGVDDRTVELCIADALISMWTLCDQL